MLSLDPQSRFFHFGVFILCMVCCSMTWSSVNKRSVQLGRVIQDMEICGDKALVAIKMNERTSKLLNIDLNTLNISTDNMPDINSKISCDESSGAYYVAGETNSQDHRVGLYAYKKLGDAVPLWQYLVDGTYYPVITNLVYAAKTVIISVGYISDKAPHDLPNIFVFDKASGKVIWKFRVLGDMELPELTAINNMLFITNNEGMIQAYDLNLLSQKWEVKKDFESRYVRPVFDKATNTLITGVEYPDEWHTYVETIGIRPETGETKWQMVEHPDIYFSHNNESSQLIYIQFDSIYTLNWYKLQNEGQPVVQYQWKDKYRTELGWPSEIHVIGNRVLVMFNTNDDDQYAYLFDEYGNKIDEIKFENQTSVDIKHSNISSWTIYAASNGEFGTLEIGKAQRRS